MKPPARRSGRRTDDTEIDIKGAGHEDVEWIQMAQDRPQWQAEV
jgi:hypothetical protein